MYINSQKKKRKKKDHQLLKDLQSTPSQTAVTEQSYIPLQGDSATFTLLKLIAACVTF